MANSEKLRLEQRQRQVQMLHYWTLSCNELHDVMLANMLSFINKRETLHNCRHERCKKRVGNQGGLLRKKAASLTVILEGTGRVGKRGTGNPVLTFLVNSQPILMLPQLHKLSSFYTWYFYLLPLTPHPFDQKYTFLTIFMITTSFSIQQIWLINALVYRYIYIYIYIRTETVVLTSSQQGNLPFPCSNWQQQLLFLLSDACFKVGLRRDDLELCMKVIVRILIISVSRHSTLWNRIIKWICTYFNAYSDYPFKHV